MRAVYARPQQPDSRSCGHDTRYRDDAGTGATHARDGDVPPARSGVWASRSARASGPRSRTIRSEDWRRLGDEIAAAKAKFGLPPNTRVVSCYEAGPDAFWIHRYLITGGVESVVVDPAGIEVNRRGRQAKTDRPT